MKYALVMILLALPAAGWPDENFRCGKWIASSDLTPAELLARCGEPDSRETRSEDVLVRNQFGLMQKNGETIIETWVYQRGKSAAPVRVTIVDGRIKSIERMR